MTSLPDRSLYIGYRLEATHQDTSKPFARVDWFADTDTYILTYLVVHEGQHTSFPEGFTSQREFPLFTARLMIRSKTQFPLYPLVYVEGQVHKHSPYYEDYLACFGCTMETYHPFDELGWHHGWRATDNYYFSLDTAYWDQ